jgi:hypothetical protein
VKKVERLTLEFCRAHGIPDIEPGGILVNAQGSREPEIGGTPNASVTTIGHAARGAFYAAAELAEAGWALVGDPRLTDKAQRVWAAYMEAGGVMERGFHTRLGVSYGTVYEVIDACKALMTLPDGAPMPRNKHYRERDPDDVPEERIVDTPPESKLPEGERFEDLEKSLELAARNAHRLIVHVSRRDILTEEDLRSNEVASRTLVAIRNAEFRYLNARDVKPGDPAEEGLRAIAGHGSGSGTKPEPKEAA